MQTTRTTLRRVPQNLFRISKPLTTTSTPKISRTLTTTAPKMSLFPRFTQEFAPLFRLMDDYDRRMLRDLPSSSSPSDGGAHGSSLFSRELRSFTPKFDVKEIEDAYELHGEFPGVEQKDINIEWTDANTLTVSGRHEHVREEGTKPTALLEGSSSSSSSSSNKQPTVEDADAPNNDNKEQSVVTTNASKDVATNNNDDRKTKYWVSERSVGEFHRSFSFPTRVDQDAVKASLKNGILSVVVPKAKAAAPRKVNIE